MIAAHALSLDVTLVTNDVRVFSPVPDLKFVDWVQGRECAVNLAQSHTFLIAANDVLLDRVPLAGSSNPWRRGTVIVATSPHM